MSEHVDKADTVELAAELNAGDTVEIEVSFSTHFMTDARDTETHEFTVESISVSDTGAEITLIDEGQYGTRHGRIDTRDQNTGDDFPAYLKAGGSKKKRRQDKQGRVEDITVIDADDDTDDDSDVSVQVGDEFDAMGETVEVTNERDDELCFHYKDREPINGQTHTAWRPRETVEAIAAREDWQRLNDDDSDDADDVAEWVSTPRCPDCGSFMSQGIDDFGFAFAQCSNVACDGELGHDVLDEQGAIVET